MPDILSLQNDTVWMRGLGVDKNLSPVQDQPHLFAPRGFLDDTWWHRTYWMYGTEFGGGYTHWPDVGNAVPAGRLLVFDGGKHIYGYGRLRYRMGDGHVRPNAVEDYKLFAEFLAAESETRVDARGEERQLPSRRKIQWTANLSFVARSLVLTRDALLVAGGASLTESTETHGPGTFWVASREEGAAYLLMIKPDPALERQSDEMIDVIAEAQQDDGYLYVSHICGVARPREMGERPYSWVVHSHELYNMGHMYEGAVAFYRATEKGKWLKVAETIARHINKVFFEGDPNYNDGRPVMQAPGHQELELALCKLYRVTGNQ